MTPKNESLWILAWTLDLFIWLLPLGWLIGTSKSTYPKQNFLFFSLNLLSPQVFSVSENSVTDYSVAQPKNLRVIGNCFLYLRPHKILVVKSFVNSTLKCILDSSIFISTTTTSPVPRHWYYLLFRLLQAAF